MSFSLLSLPITLFLSPSSVFSLFTATHATRVKVRGILTHTLALFLFSLFLLLSYARLYSLGAKFKQIYETLLFNAKIDANFVGHVHSAEFFTNVYQDKEYGMYLYVSVFILYFA